MRRTSWVWLLGIYTLAGFLETVFWGQMTAFTPIILGDLGLAPARIPGMVGIVAAIVGAAGIPFLPLWGALADKFARKPIIVRSFAIYVLAGITSMLAGSVWVFVVGRSLMSLSLGNTGLMLTTLAERTPSSRHGLAFAIMNSAGPVGAFTGPLIGGPIVDHFGFRSLMWLDVIVMIVVVLGLMFGYVDAYRGTSTAPIVKMAAESVKVAFQAGRLRMLFVAFFALYAGWMLVNAYLPVVVTALYKGTDTASAIGVVLGAGGLLALVIAPAFGWLADRFGHWPMLGMGVILETGLWLLPFWTRSLVPFAVAASTATGVAAAVFSISFSVLASSASAGIRGRVMSFAYLPVNIGYALGPMIGSQLVRHDLFYIFPAACVLTAMGALLLEAARRQPVPTNGMRVPEAD